MNFEIQKRALSRAIRDDLDALIVFWPAQSEASTGEKDPVSTVVHSAIHKGDFELKAGSLLNLYGHAGIKARHVVVVCSGENKPAHIRAAVTAAWGGLKSAKVKRLGLHMVGQLAVDVVQSIASAIWPRVMTSPSTASSRAAACRLRNTFLFTEAPIRQIVRESFGRTADVITGPQATAWNTSGDLLRWAKAAGWLLARR